MHRHITYYAQSTVCQSGFYKRISSNKFLSSSPWAYAGFAKEGQVFGGLGDVAFCEAAYAKRLLGGSGGRLPREIFLEWCVLEHIFIKFFTLKNSKNHILYKNNDKHDIDIHESITRLQNRILEISNWMMMN